MSRRILTATAIATVMGVAGAAVVSYDGGGDGGSSIAPSILGAPDGSILAAGLVSPASCDDLGATMRALVDEHGREGFGGFGPVAVFSGREAMDDLATTSETGADPMAPDAGVVDTDGTNVQELGVDEQDIVERVGDLLVVGTQGMVRIVGIVDGEPVARGELQIGQWSDLGLFAIGDDRVAVISISGDVDPVRGIDDRARSMIRPGGFESTTVALIDLSDPDNPRELSRLDLEGWLVDSRAVDGVLRVAVRSEGPQIDVYAPGEFEADRAMDWERATDEDYQRYEREFQAEYQQRTDEAMDQLNASDWQPHVRVTDAAGIRVEPMVGCDRVGFPTAFAGIGMLTVASIDATGDTLAIDDATAVVTSGQNLYSTPDRVVIASTRWEAPVFDDTPAPQPEPAVEEPFFEENESSPEATSEVLPMTTMPWPGRGGGGSTTDLHVFDVDGTVVSHVASGTVDGTLLNQFSISIHDNVLRTATTGWTEDGSESYVTTLRVEGDTLLQLGQVGDLGPNEDIQAVRFMGTTAYVVTFRRTDPLYVVDLTDPAAPRTLGELKVDGYSAYLHPLAPGQLLGIGQDADPETGQTRGVQLSTFDVSDMTKPTRIDVDVTPDSSSQAEWDHHAVTVTDAGLIIIPLEQHSSRESRVGALVYEVAADGTLTRRGILDAGTDWQLAPRRSLIMQGTLVTIADGGVLTWDATSFAPLGTLTFPGPDPVKVERPSVEGDPECLDCDTMVDNVEPQPGRP
ncbi:MAG: hypothetical protein ACI9AD_000863 [Nitriliruptoraceae bacterium]|jgi:hypothetical protein